MWAHNWREKLNYEIIRVANGFMVRKINHSRGDIGSLENTFVFNAWGDASSWLQKQFDKKTEE